MIDISATAEEKQLLIDLAERPWVRCFGYCPRALPENDQIVLTMGEFYVELDETGIYFRHLAGDESDIEYERFTIYASPKSHAEKTLEPIESYILKITLRSKNLIKKEKNVYLGIAWDGFFSDNCL